MAKQLEQMISKAVAHFWLTRKRQGQRQGGKSGRRDAGGRSLVTGGKQLDGFVGLVRELLCGAGLCDTDVHVERRSAILPGYFRPTKQWDIIAVVNGQLLASIEFKSQVGPSFGNNFNNRTEEAIGSAHDLWVAYREGAFKDSPRPWLGYMLLLEECEGSTRPVKVDEPHFPVFGEFVDASYAARYQLLCQRLVRERLYDAACMLMSNAVGGGAGKFRELSPEIGIAHFAASLTAHAQAHAKFLS